MKFLGSVSRYGTGRVHWCRCAHGLVWAGTRTLGTGSKQMDMHSFSLIFTFFFSGCACCAWGRRSWGEGKRAGDHDERSPEGRILTRLVGDRCGEGTFAGLAETETEGGEGRGCVREPRKGDERSVFLRNVRPALSREHNTRVVSSPSNQRQSQPPPPELVPQVFHGEVRMK